MSSSPAASAFSSSCCHPRLEGKVALVTGGASGIGESIVKLFCHHGAKVCIFDLLTIQLQEAKKDGHGQYLGGDRAFFFRGDVTVEDDVRRAVDATLSRFGALDIMVCNAGIGGLPVADIRDLDLGEFKRVFDVNVNGVFLSMKHAAAAMIPRGEGSIVSIASVASLLGGLAPHAYAASKHAVVGLTKSLAAEMGRHGVRVNCVSPYAVPTKMALEYLPPEEKTEDAKKAFMDFAGRVANLQGVQLVEDHVAEAVLFLASEESKYVSGHNLTVDGGFTCVNHDMRVFGPRPGQAAAAPQE